MLWIAAFGFLPLFQPVLTIFLLSILRVKGEGATDCNSSAGTCKNYGEATQLVASGIRRKNLLILEVDIYKIDVYMSPKKFQLVKKIYRGDKLDYLNDKAEDKGTHTVLNLSFLRAVGTNRIVDAIVDALAGGNHGDKYNHDLATFKSILSDNIGGSGLLLHDQLTFIFTDLDKIAIEVRGKPAGELWSKELTHNLLLLYLGENTIVPKLRAEFVEKLLL